MPFAAVADKEVKFGPLAEDEAESDFDLDGHRSETIPRAAGNSKVNCIIGVVVLSALLVAVALGRGSARGDVQADTQQLISESHFSQSCSWKCNDKFWGKGRVAQSAKEEYLKCCQECPGSACTFPCTDTCRQRREKKGSACSGDATCLGGVEEEHTECCSRCPGSVCVVRESEEGVGAAKGAESNTGLAAPAGAEAGASAEGAEGIAETCGGDAGGAPCQFPFEWHGVQYTSCTNLENDQSWCYTTVAGKWGNCNCLAS